jgi:hypothetical protein
MASVPAISCRREGKPRQRVLMAATLVTPNGAQRIRVRDLSAGGAKILSSEPLSGEFDTIFRRGQTFAAARVVWTNGQEAGLSFYRELAPSELADLARQAA